MTVPSTCEEVAGVGSITRRARVVSLTGIRVVEVCDLIAAPYAAKLLADLGAEVIKVEPPKGDRARRLDPFVVTDTGNSCGVAFLYANTSKRSVVLDLDTEPDRTSLRELLASADLLIDDRAPGWWDDHGIGYADLQSANPQLVQLSITPFGQSGPYRDFKAYPLNTFESSGEGYLTPPISRLQPDVQKRPPTRLGRFGSEYKAGTYAATIATAAVIEARRSGIGSYIDLSKQEALIGLNHLELNKWFAWEYVADRSSAGVALGGIVPCRDGFLEFSFYEEHQWRGLVALLETPSWTQEPWALDPKTRLERADEVYEHLVDALRDRSRDEVVATGQRVGCTVAPYNDIASVTRLAQFAHRGYFQPVADPVRGEGTYPTRPYRFEQTITIHAAPELGAEDVADVLRRAPATAAKATDRAARSTERSPSPAANWKLLEGVRVADFSWAVAGPTATMILAALGAEVIKIESSKRPDVTRRNAHANATVNRDKLSVTLNLQSAPGADLARQIVAQSDIVVSSFRPGVMDSLGLGYDALRALRPDLIALATSMAGLDGPAAGFSGYAPMFAAYSGLGELTGYPDGPPSQVRSGADLTVGVDGAFAVVAALLARELHGGGAVIDLSAIESQTTLVGDAVLDYLLTGRPQHRRGNQETQYAPHECYPCAGPDSWISIVVEDDDEWDRFGRAIESPAWISDERFARLSDRVTHKAELDALIGAWTSQRAAADVMARLQAAGVAAVTSYNAPSLFADPHVIARNIVANVGLPSGETMPLIRLGGVISGLAQTPLRPGPELGEHNQYVLGELLGHSEHSIDQWKADGVVV